MRFEFVLVLGLLLPGGLLITAQSAPDQSTPQAQAPAQQSSSPAEPQPAPATESNAAPQAPSGSVGQSKPSEPPVPQPGQTPADKNVAVLKHRPGHKRAHKKAANSQSGKVVVRNGGAIEGTPELAPGSGQEQEQHKRENTNQLLATTEANLKSVEGRQLTPAQQSMMEQIRAYLAQSKVATNGGDLERAHTLAYKAHLLSDELAKK